jgi:hypothetical protein
VEEKSKSWVELIYYPTLPVGEKQDQNNILLPNRMFENGSSSLLVRVIFISSDHNSLQISNKHISNIDFNFYHDEM